MKEKYNPKQEIDNFSKKISKYIALGKKIDKKEIIEVFDSWNKNILQDGFFKYFVKSQTIISFTELLFLLLKSNCLIKKTRGILKQLILKYFENEVVNKDFLSLLNKSNFKLLHDYYFKNGIRSNKHTESIIEICEENKDFISCVKVFRKLWLELNFEENKYKHYMKNVEFFDLFFLLNNIITKKYHFEKLSSHEKALKYVDISSLTINDILNEKRKIDNKIYDQDLDKIKSDIIEQQLVNYSPIDKAAENLFEFYDKKRRFNELIKDITELDYNYFTEDEIVHLSPKNKDYFISLKNTEISKEIYLNFLKFFIQKGIENIILCLDDLNKKTIVNIENEANKLKILFGEEVLGLDSHNVINIIHKLAERSIRKYEIDPLPTKIKDHTGWGVVNYRTIKHLSEATPEKVTSKRKLSEEEMTKYMDIFSNDINNKNEDINLKTKPFLKYNDTYIWGHLFLAYKDLSTLFVNNLILKNIKNKSIIKELSDKFEKSVKKIFSDANIKNLSNCSPSDSNIQKYKDIDILAFKDNYLFIVETKLTYNRLNYWEINDHINGALKKGKRQLQERIKNIHCYLTDEVKNELGIKNDDFKIIPLIITSSFEGDFNYGDGVSKYSIFELSFVLNSNLEDIYLQKNVIKEFCNSILSEAKSKQMEEEHRQIIEKYSFKNSLEKYKEKINDIEFHIEV